MSRTRGFAALGIRPAAQQPHSLVTLRHKLPLAPITQHLHTTPAHSGIIKNLLSKSQCSTTDSRPLLTTLRQSSNTIERLATHFEQVHTKKAQAAENIKLNLDQLKEALHTWNKYCDKIIKEHADKEEIEIATPSKTSISHDAKTVTINAKDLRRVNFLMRGFYHKLNDPTCGGMLKSDNISPEQKQNNKFPTGVITGIPARSKLRTFIISFADFMDQEKETLEKLPYKVKDKTTPNLYTYYAKQVTKLYTDFLTLDGPPLHDVAIW